MQSLFVLDVTRGYLPAVLLTAAAYVAENGEAMLVQGGADHDAVRLAVERFRPTKVLAMAGCTPSLSVGRGPDSSLPVEQLPHDNAALLAWLIERAVEKTRGVVLFPGHSPSWAVKAASLAVRLGYLAWPMEEASGFAYSAPSNLPVLVVGEAPGALADALQGREFRHLPGDRAIANYLWEQGIPVDYVVLVNTSDLEPPHYTDGSMGNAWTAGLSLLAPVLSSYRSAVVIDARSPRVEPRDAERTLNQKLADTGLRPDYLAILASPGAIPFLSAPQTAFAGGEDLVRDIHLRFNQDLFFDCAEGRIFGSTAGRVSLQLLSTKHYAALEGAYKRRALIAARPHVDGKTIFAIDEAVGRAQIVPILEKAGLKTEHLYGTECSPAKIGKHMPGAGFIVYGGHGAPDSLSTHQAPLYAEFLPHRLAPGVVYACACSTMYPKPARYSADGGFSHEEEVLPFGEQIGPAFIERGALAFVGGLTAEDVLLNTPMYVAFTQALILKGQSVGQAVRAARNYALAYLAILSQLSPEAFLDYRGKLANTVQQQAVLGDPAFAPYKGTSAAALPVHSESAEEHLTLTVSVPEERWIRLTVPVDPGYANKEFHRARSLETRIPVGENVCNWGENYTVASDRDGLSEKGVMGSFLHLSADLPPGRVPISLRLEQVEAADQECMLCGTPQPAADALEWFRNPVLPFQGNRPPVRLDQSGRWAYAVEETPTGLRVHWLMPALAVEDRLRRAAELRSATFVLQHAPGIRAEGRLEVAQGSAGKAPPGALEGTRGLLPEDLLLSFFSAGEESKGATVNQILSGPGGRWSCWLPLDSDLHLKMLPAMPVFRHGSEAALGIMPDPIGPFKAGSTPVALSMPTPDLGSIRGVVIDAHSGRPLAGAKVRLWQGAKGEKPAIRGYVGETKADAHGRFEYIVPVGTYLLQTAHRTDLRYFTGKGTVSVHKGKEAPVLIAMEPGAILRGRVSFRGPYAPRHVDLKLLEHDGKEEKPIGGGKSRRDGQFEILVLTGTPFDILMHPEGYRRLRDTNGGEGYHPSPGETLERNFALEWDD